MTVRGIDHDHIDACIDQHLGALLGAFADADRRADPQTPEPVLARERMLGGLQDVLGRDQAAQIEVLVDHQHALEPVLVHQRHCLFAACAFAHRDQLRARRHDVPDRLAEIGFKAQIAVGDDADHAARGIDHRQAGNLVLIREVQHIAHGHVLRDRDRILDHAALEALDLGDLRCLGARRHVLVDYADAAFLGNRNRQPRFGHGVHRGGQPAEY